MTCPLHLLGSLSVCICDFIRGIDGDLLQCVVVNFGHVQRIQFVLEILQEHSSFYVVKPTQQKLQREREAERERGGREREEREEGEREEGEREREIGESD